MTLGKKQTSASPIISFSDVVDETCEKLLNLQITHTIRRIHEMEKTLTILERELDDFLLRKNRKM